MQNGLLTQLGLIVVSGVIVMTYVMPTFEAIGALQDELFEYEQATNQAEQFNQLIRSLTGELDAVSSQNISALQTYLPMSLDGVKVLSDIERIARLNAISLVSASVGSGEEIVTGGVSEETVFVPGLDDVTAPRESQLQVYSQEFTVSLIGSYSSFINFLEATERNAYPLDVIAMQLTPNEGILYSYDVTFRTYALGNTN